MNEDNKLHDTLNRIAAVASVAISVLLMGIVIGVSLAEIALVLS